MRIVFLVALIAIIALLFASSGCVQQSPPPNSGTGGTNGGTGGTGGTSPQTFNVSISNFAFNPVGLSIKKGDTVIWTNDDSTQHTVTSDSGSELGSQLLSNGQIYSHTFNNAGTFNYHCSVHSFMGAKITVQ